MIDWQEHQAEFEIDVWPTAPMQRNLLIQERIACELERDLDVVGGADVDDVPVEVPARSDDS